MFGGLTSKVGGVHFTTIVGILILGGQPSLEIVSGNATLVETQHSVKIDPKAIQV